MFKFNKLVNDYEYNLYEKLPKFMKRRVDALKKLQLEHIQIQHQYHKELQELELKYEKLYKPLYDKRHMIIIGEHVPTDEECQLPATIEFGADAGDQENNVEIEPNDFDINLSEEEEKQVEPLVKGIPGFWLGCLVSSFNFADSVEEWDKDVLKSLIDIRLSYEPEGEFLTYKLDFMFADNPYFTNKVLTKKYYLKSKPDEKDPFSYEGFEVVKSEGCEINWNPGKNVTMEVKTVKQVNKANGRSREKKKEKERDSFFYFFKPPNPPIETDDLDAFEEAQAIMAVDFELGESIRQSMIPKAVLYYTGYMADDEDDGDDMSDEDDLSDEEDSDDERINYNSDDDEESYESSDSLNAANDKKKLTPNSKKSPSSKGN